MKDLVFVYPLNPQQVFERNAIVVEKVKNNSREIIDKLLEFELEKIFRKNLADLKKMKYFLSAAISKY